ncbi:hypothetical protein NX722_14165 [Endozoicomonas gorgoniicola]|uniref:Uracil-DNA glycosylase-like domain-containing protein n=1 Tax=Endozoicomonas gorgoniicola TaxID=1234144 RepID=A0ABT3MWK0_9GAMM|nr:hypothetical protein [Endozoicomonas gorgoniicola]MCW7553755.1 hypothetical protein [Endozoicomonas gorgoniicola]
MASGCVFQGLEGFRTGTKYSGVFLPFHFKAYEKSSPKVMIIGRETAGWNTNNNKNKLRRIIDKNNDGLIDEIIEESFFRYSWHLKNSPDGTIKKRHSSKFQHYYNKVSKELDLSPEGMIYANLFAWDYNKKSPLERPEEELKIITGISLELLASQIRFFEPDYIIFATGYRGIDPIIKELFNRHFNGYETIRVNPKKIWEFNAANKKCFRIAHPRAQHGHAEFRKEVIEHIKGESKTRENA